MIEGLVLCKIERIEEKFLSKTMLQEQEKLLCHYTKKLSEGTRKCQEIHSFLSVDSLEW